MARESTPQDDYTIKNGSRSDEENHAAGGMRATRFDSFDPLKDLSAEREVRGARVNDHDLYVASLIAQSGSSGILEHFSAW
jgi:hypothetical protein